MPSVSYTLFYFLIALLVLITFHEYGHFITARLLGVKVLRFSIGFGKLVWSYRSGPDQTEYAISAIPLGGYVKMVDEREGEVSEADLPYAFNRQALWKRSLIVAAGPAFNFLLAVLLYWAVFMIGETGAKPVIGPVAPTTLAGKAGFKEGDELLAIDGAATPTWSMAITTLIEKALTAESLDILLRRGSGQELVLPLSIPQNLAEKPEQLRDTLGLLPWQPKLKPVIGRLEPDSVAVKAGLKTGDLLVSMGGQPINDWQSWVDYVRARPEQEIKLIIDRGGLQQEIHIIPAPKETAQGRIGRIGAAVQVPEDLIESMTVVYKLDPFPALRAAWAKSLEYSVMTVTMMARMLAGSASADNLSGPISIAQYAGQSAKLGLVHFLKFLAVVSISLTVLNLMPIPVLDGGHLVFFLAEGIKGKPLTEATQAFFQQAGMFVLLILIVVAFYMDIERLLT
jgi:regulator of sigma E protease